MLVCTGVYTKHSLYYSPDCTFCHLSWTPVNNDPYWLVETPPDPITFIPLLVQPSPASLFCIRLWLWLMLFQKYAS